MSNIAVLSVILFFITSFINNGISIPTAKPRLCNPPEPLIFNHGETVHLECGSYCSSASADDSSEQFIWSKKVLRTGNVKDLPATAGPMLTIKDAEFSNGGEFSCRCAQSTHECSYNVSVIPVMTFVASDTFVHIGDTFDLSCTLSGFPTNFSRITSKLKGEPLPHHMQKQISTSATKSYVPVFEPEGNVYVCEAEVYFMEELIAQYREEVTVDVYDPPSIIYTTEFIISNKNEFGLSGEVTCTTQASAQVSSTVSWFTRGTEITNSTKYSIVTLPTDSEEDEIVKYKLIVSDLQETDIGSYLCRLNSMYGMEDMQEAWIKVDYRKNDEATSDQGSTHAPTNKHPTNKHEHFAGPTAGQNNVLFFAFCGFSVVAAAMVLWKMSTRQRPHSINRKARPSHSQYMNEAGNDETFAPSTDRLPRKQC